MVRPLRSGLAGRLASGTVIASLLLLLSSAGCPRSQKPGGSEPATNADTTTLGEVRVGKELARLYIAYAPDAAVLGLAISSDAGPTRYFPMFASTYRGVPAVVLEVFASKGEDELWIRSSWPDNELLAYHRIGSETAITQWGEMHSIKKPMPDFLSGGAPHFPALVRDNVVKKATFKHE
jgi:hypothetical protein